MILLRIHPSEEVRGSLERQLADLEITDAAIVALIGAVDACGISNMTRDDHTKNVTVEIEQPLELSGTGEVKAGDVHVHCTVSNENGFTEHGHLHWARVDNHFVHAYIIPL